MDERAESRAQQTASIECHPGAEIHREDDLLEGCRSLAPRTSIRNRYRRKVPGKEAPLIDCPALVSPLTVIG